MSTDGPGAGRTGRIAEVRGDEASPEVRAIYADIRRATGIPQVNLIFRHLAVEPVVLAWVWDVIGPLYRDGRIAAAAGRLGAGIALPRHAALWEAAPLQAQEAAQLRAVLDCYERGNAANLLGLTALLEAVDRAGGQRSMAAEPAERGVDAPTGAPIAAMPPMPRREEIDPAALTLVDELAARHGSGAAGVTPSLYLHIALWPEAIRRAHRTVLPLLGTPEWDDRVRRLVAEAGAQARGWAGGLPRGTPPPEAVLRPYLATVRLFVERIIPPMVLVGRVLAGRGGDPG